jgi:5-methyltetrahydrofolate--homocysteine methyltransferase
MEAIRAANVLMGTDQNCTEWIMTYRDHVPAVAAAPATGAADGAAAGGGRRRGGREARRGAGAATS